jgi:hypothetical protein
MIRKVKVGLLRLVYRKNINGRSGLTGIILMLLSFAGTAQTVTPVPVTGFTADVIANGATFAGSVNADVDGGGYYFLNQTFTAFGTPTYYLPNSGLINSAASSLVSFQLADASANNSLRLIATNASGILTLATPQTAGVVYLLATSGGGAGTISVTLNFSDGTTQTNAGIAVPQEAIQKGLKFFLMCQTAEGGFGYTSGNSPNGARTAIGCLVFALAKEKNSKAFQSAFNYLKRAPAESHYQQYYLYYASQAFFHGSQEAWQVWNRANIKILGASQNADGGWDGQFGSTFSTSASLLSLALNYRFLPIYER